MGPVLSARRGALWRSLRPENRYHGLQLVVVVVLAYGASIAVDLPERVWAPMSALIVMRPSADSTIDAGLARAVGTMLGAVFGMLGVLMQHVGVNALAATVAIVAGLAFISVTGTTLRSAPVAALVILTAGALPGHSALQVAMLRVVQIVIGVGVAMAVALISSRYRASQRLGSGSAKLLRLAAKRVAQAGAQSLPNEADAELAGEAARQALGRLTGLARSADRVLPWSLNSGKAGDGRYHRRIAALTSRVFQDVIVFHRLVLVESGKASNPLWHEPANVARAALLAAASTCEGAAVADLSKLRQLAYCGSARSNDESAMATPPSLLAAPLHLLLEDLQRLCHCVRRSPENSRRDEHLSANQN